MGVEGLCGERSELCYKRAAKKTTPKISNESVVFPASYLLLGHVKGAVVHIGTRADNPAKADVLAVHRACPHARDVDYGGGGDGQRRISSDSKNYGEVLGGVREREEVV